MTGIETGLQLEELVLTLSGRSYISCIMCRSILAVAAGELSSVS